MEIRIIFFEKMNFEKEEKTDWNGPVKIRLDLNNRF